MDFLLGLWLGYMVSPTALSIVVVLGLLLEYKDQHVLSVILTAVVLGIAYHLFPIAHPYGVWLAGAYFPVGVVWSFWRYRRFLSERVKEFNAQTPTPTESDIKYFRRTVYPGEQWDALTCWVLAWPLSLVEYSLRDLFHLVDTTVRTVFRRAYYAIFEAATQDLQPSAPKQPDNTP